HTWHFCKRHYGKQVRKKYGTCSYRERRENGSLDNCTALRATNTRGKGRKLKGYCRRHEDQYLVTARDGAVDKALNRLADSVTVKAERSEERRVGKECRAGWATAREKTERTEA